VLALGDGRGLEFRAVRRPVGSSGTPLGEAAPGAIFWAVLGALAGGILLNLMPCVFPILGLKTLHISKAGESASEMSTLGCIGFPLDVRCRDPALHALPQDDELKIMDVT